MKELDINKLIDMNYRLLLILGFGSGIIIELSKSMPEGKKANIYWFLEAMENLLYLDKPLPPMPISQS